MVTIDEQPGGESELQSRMAVHSPARDIYVRTRLCPMRDRIVITAHAAGVHVIAALAALAHDEARRCTRTRSNAVLPSRHCANHTVRRCGRLRDAQVSRMVQY
jgi:hypothetical protein